MFNFSFDKRVIYIIIGILVLSTLYKYATVEGALLGLAFTIPGVIIAIAFHEFAHAFVADKLGDHTARMEGRLTLNPLAHLDPIGSLLLLFAGFGWGKPVHVEPRNYTRKMSVEKAQAIVSIAGPIMNFLLAIVFSVITCIIIKTTNSIVFWDSGLLFVAGNSTTIEVVLKILIYAIITNIGLGLFNLIPLPPLDGSKVIMPILPFKAKQFFLRNEMMFYIAFIIVYITPMAREFISSVILSVGSGLFQFVQSIFGIYI